MSKPPYHFDGPWSASFPEEGDQVDLTVTVVNNDHDEWEIIELTEGTTTMQINAAQRIAFLLNKYGGKLL